MSSDEGLAESATASRYRVAVLVPCYNEERAIAKAVAPWSAARPTRAKGHVVRRMFNDVQADVYVLVDGDATYDAASAPAMVAKLIEERLDMVVAARTDREPKAYSHGHRARNRLLTGFVTHMFGRSFTDILSGYRAFSRRFVKSFPILSGGFEIETELTVHTLELELPVGEIATPYYARPAGWASKLSTWKDGLRIMWTVLKLYRAERPLALFGAFGLALAIISIGLAIPIFVIYVEEGLVPRLPTAVLSTGLMLLAFLSIACGLILDTVTRSRRELKLIAYLVLRAPGEEG